MMHKNRPIPIVRTLPLNKAPSKRSKIIAVASLLLMGAALFAAQTAFAQTKPKKGAPAAQPAAAAPEAAPAPAPTTAGDPVLTNRATEMYKMPDSDSPVVEKLPAKTQVRVVDRKGKWHRVIAASNATGYVNMMHLRGETIVVASASEPGFLSGITGALSASSGSGSQKSQGATLGIRGLTPEDLQNASPNPTALAKVRSFKAESSEAERFSREANLKKADASLIDSNGKPTALKL
jgi:uncharacterized protein YgiM (DUF1202 family)